MNTSRTRGFVGDGDGNTDKIFHGGHFQLNFTETRQLNGGVGVPTRRHTFDVGKADDLTVLMRKGSFHQLRSSYLTQIRFIIIITNERDISNGFLTLVFQSLLPAANRKVCDSEAYSPQKVLVTWIVLKICREKKSP